MLKIKDNVSLKILRKYGFTLEDNDYIWIEGIEDICIDKSNREIIVYGDYERQNFSLGKANLVEKVEDR